MWTRKLTVVCGLATIAFVLGFSAVAFAASSKHTAHMVGTVVDPRAEGRAVWQADPHKLTLTVTVQNVKSCTLAAVFIDDQLVGLMDIVDGAGFLEVATLCRTRTACRGSARYDHHSVQRGNGRRR